MSDRTRLSAPGAPVLSTSLPSLIAETAISRVKKPFELKLFRDEVVDNRLNAIGVPLAIADSWMRAYVGLLVLAIIAVLVVVVTGNYARKSRVSGFLLPDKGLIKIVPDRPGQIVALHVAEGDHVRAKDPLAVVEVDVISLTGGTNALVLTNLAERRKLIMTELARLDDIHRTDRERLIATLASQKDQIAAVDSELVARRDRLRLMQSSFERNTILEGQKVYSTAQAQKAESDVVSARIEIATLNRVRAATDGQLAEFEAKLRGLSQTHDNETSQVQRLLAELDQQILQIENQQFRVLRAVNAGVVTRITGTIGAFADPSTPLLTVVPDGARLDAYLYVPSSAAGFLKIGEEVQLRYDAFPYQKFGVQKARVMTVSRAAVPSKELPIDVGTSEPLYLVTARPLKSTITAFGREEPLVAGMKLDADLVLETRKIWEWLFEPVLAARQSL
jgi:membrane fusion protein